MCGILGTYNIDASDIKPLLENLEIRGRDGTGWFHKSQVTGNTSREKSDKKPIDMMSNLRNIRMGSIFIANTRAVPTTEYKSGAGFDVKNQQPFEDDRYVVVHNGIISNDKELREEYNIVTESTVDTSILPQLFHQLGVVEGMRKLEGSYAIMVYDKDEEKFYVGRNFMPMHYYIGRDYFKFISSQEMDEQNLEKMEPYMCYEISTFGSNNVTVTKHSLWQRKQNNKALIICSSGIDSTTTAYLYKHLGYEVGLIHFTYGQAAQEAELHAIKQISKDLDAELYVYDAVPTFAPFKDSSRLLYQTEANPEDQMKDAETTHSYVPNRNAILAMIAAGVAEMKGYDTLAYGGQQMDSVYPDNNPDFVEGVDALLKYSLNWHTNVHFAAPLIHLIKHEIVALGQLIGADYGLTCSCYYPKVVDDKVEHCHKCGCCQFRDAALEMVEERDFIPDADIYISKYVLPFI